MRLVATALLLSGGLPAAGPGDPQHPSNNTGDRYGRLTRTAGLPAPEPPARVTDTQIERWLAQWQRRLRLEDWAVEAHLVRAAELKPNTLGNVKWDRDKKTASIRILDPADYDLPAAAIPADIENTVVHELVHIRLCALLGDRRDPKVEESVVNPIVGALLEAERRGAQVTANRR